MQSYGTIYQYQTQQHQPQKVKPFRFPSFERFNLSKQLAVGLIALSLGGITGPLTPAIRLESTYWVNRVSGAMSQRKAEANAKPLPKSVPVVFNPLKTEDGSSIDPASKEFGLIIPKVGINTSVIPAVNPTNPGEYLEALKKGVAHASTSYFPDEDGTMYLFSHSTNYDWFVSDLNAVFYLLKNLTEGDLIIVYYKGSQYTYKLREKRVVAPTETSYLIPQKGTKTLILQTCWPPGSTTERLLLFADLIGDQVNQI
ncbi:sortase [Candidatus Gottesmanbacteria bacterium]|nr:sortase [Candidatus Gottesmanbacteria bacterium]